MARKTDQERLDELEETQSQINARRKDLRAKIRKEERNKRTKRLVKLGGAVESVLGKPIEEEDLPKLLNFLYKQEKNGKYFSKAMEGEKKNPEGVILNTVNNHSTDKELKNLFSIDDKPVKEEEPGDE